MWSFSPESSMIEEPIPTNFLQLGRDKLFQAQEIKATNLLQAITLYHEASSYFTQAIHTITDNSTKTSILYLAHTAKRNAELLETSLNIAPVEQPIEMTKMQESFGGRPAFTGSRGKTSGVSKVPRAIALSDDDFSKDLLTLESKLSQIGLMPPTVLLKEKSTQMTSSMNFSTSRLEDSFLYLSPSSQTRKESYGRLQSEQSHLFPSTISQKPLPNNTQQTQSPSSTRMNEKQPVSGPYGGKKKVDIRRPPASWGTGGFLSWATTGYQQQQQAPQMVKAEPSLDSPQSSSLSVNWNDRSFILGDNNAPLAQSFSSSAGALQLLGTIKRLNEENQRLESLVEKLQYEKQKAEIVKEQVEEFKKEYHEKLRRVQQKLSINANHTTTDNLQPTSDKKSQPPINPEILLQLEKTVRGLTEKCRLLKDENKRKDLVIKGLEETLKSVDLSKEEREKLGSLSDRSSRSPSSISNTINHPNISAQHLASLSQRRATSASPSTATLTTSLKRDLSSGGLASIPLSQQIPRKAHNNKISR